MADIRFWFDPVCPFAWLASEWIRAVGRQRTYEVEWRFISLRLLNAHIDYDTHFPPEYEAGHTAGLHLLRVCAQAREDGGPEAVGRLYEALGHQVFDADPSVGAPAERLRGGDLLATALADAGLPASLASALDDDGWDALVQAETDEALALAGKDVGTPVLQVAPPDGPAFFGPVISRRPSDAEALELWDHVVGLARFPGFAELKRSLRERPQLPSYGIRTDEVGVQEDWHAGSRRQKR